ncbi:MAG TPA: ABC transporter permease [Acidimicrobiales bacterium]|nr:ABC transporter permease [Acidimicrobiales bacterium]
MTRSQRRLRHPVSAPAVTSAPTDPSGLSGFGRRRSPLSGDLPAPVAALAGLALVLLALPLASLLAQVPWSGAGGVLSRAATTQALRLSLVTSLSAATLALVLGVPVAWLLARPTVPGLGLIRALATLPLVLPPVVAGVALLAAFGPQGTTGRWLEDVLGVRLAFSTAGVVLAELFVAMPFVVLTTEAGLRQLDRRHEEAAATLGAGRWAVFRTVTVPLAAPSLAAGAALAWARALGEFGATITFAGNLPGRTQTLPTSIYLALEDDPGAAGVLSALLVVAAVAVLVALRGRWLVRPGGPSRGAAGQLA